MIISGLFIITKPVNNPNIYIKENGLTKLQYIYIMMYWPLIKDINDLRYATM